MPVARSRSSSAWVSRVTLMALSPKLFTGAGGVVARDCGAVFSPRVTLENGVPSLKDAYGAGVGPWDRFMIPQPAARVTIRYGRPFEVAAGEAGLADGLREAGRRLEEIAGALA